MKKLLGLLIIMTLKFVVLLLNVEKVVMIFGNYVKIIILIVIVLTKKI